MSDTRKYTPDAVTAVLEHMLSTAKWLDSQGLYVRANGVNSAHDIITAQAQEIEALREIAETKTAARQRIMEECNALTAEVDGLTEQLRALRAQVQDQALHLISAHAQAEEAHADAQRYKRELLNIADTKRFKRDVFETDAEWADWAQSRARYFSSDDAAADEAVNKAAT